MKNIEINREYVAGTPNGGSQSTLKKGFSACLDNTT